MRIILLLSILVYVGNSYAQGLLNNGADIVLQSNSNVLIAGNGNLENNGTVTCNNNSTVHFIGNSNQLITGSSSTTFSNLTINNTGGDVILDINSGVNGTMQMNSGDFDLKDYNIEFSATATLSNEASARRIKSTDGGGIPGLGTGTIYTIRNNPSGNVAGLGLNITPAGNLGSTRFIRGHHMQQGSGSFTGNYSILRYYEYQPTTYNNCSFTFNYFPAFELNGHTDGQLIAFQEVQYVSNGSPGPIYWEPLTSNNPSPSATATTVTTALQSSVKITLGSQNIPLPIELLSFSANCLDDKTQLNWATATETDNNYFEIEKSNNGNNFENIGIVYGAGNSSSIINYEFDDNNKTEFTSYYRLKIVDFDNNFTYSKTISTNCKETANTEVNIYNPANGGTIYISLKNNKELKYNLLITDKLGRKIENKIFNIEDKNRIIKINKKNLSSGLYNISFYSDKNIYTEQIFIGNIY